MVYQFLDNRKNHDHYTRVSDLWGLKVNMLIILQACPQEVAAQVAGLAAGLHAQACFGMG
jgi:hypothetical protein